MKVLDDRILVRRDAAEAVSSGGIVLPHEAKEPAATGEVCLVGPGRLLQNGVTIPMTVAVGDRIHFNPHTGYKVEVQAELEAPETLMVMRESDVLLILS